MHRLRLAIMSLGAVLLREVRLAACPQQIGHDLMQPQALLQVDQQALPEKYNSMTTAGSARTAISSSIRQAGSLASARQHSIVRTKNGTSSRRRMTALDRISTPR